MYMIYNPQANQPRMRHESLDVARNEAIRLAKLHPGQQFYIMEDLGFFSIPAPIPPAPSWTPSCEA